MAFVGKCLIINLMFKGFFKRVDSYMSDEVTVLRGGFAADSKFKGFLSRM